MNPFDYRRVGDPQWPPPHDIPIIIPELPPSANNIRVISWKQRKQFLTKEADAYRKRFLSSFVPNNTALIAQLNREAIYEVTYYFFFPRDEILNRTFGQGKKDSAKSRYKKMDAENRLKFLSDCFAEAIGIDDSHFFSGGYEKFCCECLPDKLPQVHIWFAPREPHLFGL